MRFIRFAWPIALASLSVIAEPHTAHAQFQMGQAPTGPAKRVATAAIADAGHPCSNVLDAIRLNDGTIRAVCSTGDAYRIFSFVNDGETTVMAMNCSAAAKLGISGC